MDYKRLVCLTYPGQGDALALKNPQGKSKLTGTDSNFPPIQCRLTLFPWSTSSAGRHFSPGGTVQVDTSPLEYLQCRSTLFPWSTFSAGRHFSPGVPSVQVDTFPLEIQCKSTLFPWSTSSAGRHLSPGGTVQVDTFSHLTLPFVLSCIT